MQLRSGVIFPLALLCATRISRLSLMHLNESYISFWVLSSTTTSGSTLEMKKTLDNGGTHCPLKIRRFGNPMHFNAIVLCGMRIWFAWLVLHKKWYVSTVECWLCWHEVKVRNAITILQLVFTYTILQLYLFVPIITTNYVSSCKKKKSLLLLKILSNKLWFWFLILK